MSKVGPAIGAVEGVAGLVVRVAAMLADSEPLPTVKTVKLVTPATPGAVARTAEELKSKLVFGPIPTRDKLSAADVTTTEPSTASSGRGRSSATMATTAAASADERSAHFQGTGTSSSDFELRVSLGCEEEEQENLTTSEVSSQSRSFWGRMFTSQ